MNLTKDVQDLYTKNSKTLLREIKEDLYKWSDMSLWVGTRHCEDVNSTLA